MTKIRRLSRRFLHLKAQHIYISFNKEEDWMFKEALQLDGHPTIFERLSN
jgi:hypothetical protein